MPCEGQLGVVSRFELVARRGMWQHSDMPKRPRDPNQLAKLVVDIATGESQDQVSESERKAKHKRRAGGLKGGKSRAESLTPQEREDIARLAARTRWKKTD